MTLCSHQPQQDAGGEHRSADEKRLMMSGPQTFLFFLLIRNSSTAVGGGAGDALGFCCRTPFIWDLLSSASDCCMVAFAPAAFSAGLCLSRCPAALQREGWADPGDARTPIASPGHGESGSWRVAAEHHHCAGHTGQVPSVPPALKISSRTLGWAVFVALGAYQLLPLTR